MAAAGTLAVPHPRRALIHACAGMGRKALRRAGQLREGILPRLFVRLDLFRVKVVHFALICTVQFPLQVLVALAQLVGGAVVNAVLPKQLFPLVGQAVVDRLCPGDLALGRFEHLGNVTAQLARQLDHAACLQILERGLNLLGGLTGVLSGQTAAAACHGVGPVQDQHLQRRVKISVKHNAGRGLAVEQRQCVPAAVSGEQ